MAHTQIKPRPEIYRLAAELIDQGQELFSGSAILAATNKIMVKCDLERREAIAKMHRNQIAAMTGRTDIAIRYLDRMGNKTDMAVVAAEDKRHNEFSSRSGMTVTQQKQQRVTALLLMADIVENPNT